ncbi:DNA topoisomerase III [Nematocida sp. AWRm80]|nr:DNA topoisomerase III [Nematocida sp. AWRm80]
MKILNVAEKPSVSKALTEILSGGRYSPRNGSNKYCKNYSFEYMLGGKRASMVFTSVLGHLYTLQFTKNTSWGEIEPKELFDSEVQWSIPEGMKDVSSNILTQSKGCSMLIIWTDCDREGENIGAQIVKLVGKRIPIAKRARFSGLSAYEVKRAIETLGEINMNEANAVSSRIQVDLRIGAALTRYQTQQLQGYLQEKAVISYGSCQIPTLGFVCEREEQIDEFVEEPKWTLEAHVHNNKSTGEFKWHRGYIYDQTYVQLKYEQIENKEMHVKAIIRKQVTKRRPAPLRTVELQKFIVKRKIISTSNELMKIAEELYTKGYISYPRTETDLFPVNFDAHSPIIALRTDTILGDYATRLAPGVPVRGRNNDQAHTPIYPMRNGNGLIGKQREVFEYVARRFLATYSQDAKGVEEKIICQVEKEQFIRTTLTVTEKNYLEIFPYEKWGDTQRPLGLSEGQKVSWSSTTKESQTDQPRPLTEADLITKMDQNGIGTDATIHDHIQKIKDRNYIYSDTTSALKSTWIGKGLIKGYKEIEIPVGQPDLRKAFEISIRQVCSGDQHPQAIIDKEISLYKTIYNRLENKIIQFKAVFQAQKDQNNQPPHQRTLSQSRPKQLDRQTKETKDINQFKEVKEFKEAKGRGENRDQNNRIYYTPDVAKALKALYQRDPKTAKNIQGPESFQAQKIQNQFLATENQKQSKMLSSGPATGFDLNASFLELFPEDTLFCLCNLPAKEHTVKKEGTTKGKAFYSCSMRQCDFFQWKDQLSTQPKYIPKFTNAKPSNYPTHSKIYKSSKPVVPAVSETNPRCECNLFAKRFVSGTPASANRVFFKCNKSYKPCKFFKWEDS